MTCECLQDGFCNRYQRDMYGRMRELCRGINVDIGTAAAFREQWQRESGIQRSGHSKHLLLKTGQAPGDAVAMTSAIYSLHQAHPGKFTTSVESYWPDVFAYNPLVTEHVFPGNPHSATEVQMHYPAVHQSNTRGIHFMQGWCEFLGAALELPVPLMTNRPHIYFDTPAPRTEDFWLICSGGKRDFTNKLWGGYQEVVDRLQGKVRFVQVGGAKPIVPWSKECLGSQEDEHPKLNGVVDMVGQTSLRELFELARRAQGVLCGVSLLMHVAAALEKPAVVVAGGREPVQWNAYPKQHYLHTIGMLSCCENSACWRYRVMPLGDGTELDRNTCASPINGFPECMTLITPQEVAEKLLRIPVSVHRQGDIPIVL